MPEDPDITPGVQRDDPTSQTANLESKLERERVERAEELSLAEIERAARLATLKVIEDQSASALREALAVEVARKQGAIEARLTFRIEDCEARLDAINGSIDSAGKSMRSVADKVDDLIEQSRIRAALEKQQKEAQAEIERERVSQLKRANDSMIGSRMFKVGVASIAVPLIGNILLDVLKAIHIL